MEQATVDLVIWRCRRRLDPSKPCRV